VSTVRVSKMNNVQDKTTTCRTGLLLDANHADCDDRASPHLIWGVEDKRGSLYVLDAAARHFTLGRSSKCDVCLDPALG